MKGDAMTALEITHQIVSMKAGLTKGSQSPMWRCVTADNERVNVFQHSDPTKNNALLFQTAGYLLDMAALKPEEEITWKQHPIGVTMIKSGQWWEVTAVAPRPDGAIPDPIFVPDLDWHRRRAIKVAAMLLTEDTYFIDTETTGVDQLAEVIAVGVVDNLGNPQLDTLVRPQNLAAAEATFEIHGISQLALCTAPQPMDVMRQLCSLLDARLLVAYNAEFDVRLLHQTARLNDLVAPLPIGVHDAMMLYAEFAGKWDAPKQRFQAVKLTDAADELGIKWTEAHNAMADAMTLQAIVESMAMA
jgi:DNA polymerase III epsilon subunit-like protein